MNTFSPQPVRREPPRRLDRAGRRRRARQRILRSTAVLPSLLTIFNGLSGFACIHYATRHGLGAATFGVGAGDSHVGLGLICL